jgi:translocation and assembly module TamB
VPRRRRWILRILLGLFGLLAVLVIAALLVLANLDAGPIKRIIQGEARNAGVELDFADGSVTPGRLRLRDVKLLSPTVDRDLAPAFVSIAAIDGTWSPLSRRVDDLVIRDVTVTIVQNEDGTTSLDRFVAGMPPSEPAPPQPLSRLLDDLLPADLAAKARVENVKLVVVPRGKGERLEVVAPSLAAELAGGTLTAKLGPSEARARLGEKEAVVKLDGGATVARNALAATLDVTLVSQSFSKDVPPVSQVASLALTATFQPEQARTLVKVEKLALLDGAATATLDAELLDGEPVGEVVPRVAAATCRLDLAALARALPPEVGPIAIDADPITCRAKDVSLVPAPRGQVFLDGELRRLQVGDLEVRGVKLAIEARPDGDALTARAKIPVASVVMPGLTVEGVDVDLTANRAAGAKDGWPIELDGTVAAAAVATTTEKVTGAKVAVDATLKGPRTADATLGVVVSKIAAAALVEDVDLKVTARDLVLADEPLRSTGAVAVRGTLGRVAQPKGPQASGVGVALETRLAGADPARARLSLTAARLAVPGMGRDLPPAPLELTVDVPRLELDARDPARSKGEATFAATHGAASIEGRAAGSAESATWDVKAKTNRFGPARAISLASKGTFGAVITQETTVDVGRVATETAALRGAHVVVSSTGTTRKQDATISAALDGVEVQGKSAGSPRLEIVAAADLTGPRFDVKLSGKSPDANLRLAGSIDGKNVVRWELDGKVSRLAPIAALLPEGPDWKDVVVDVKGKGTVAGVVRRVQGGVPELVADPAATARGKQTFYLAVRDVSYKGADETEAEISTLNVDVNAELGEPHRLAVEVSAPEFGGVASGVHLSVKGLTARLDAKATRRGAGDLKLIVRAKEIKQSAFAYYPVRDLEIGVAVENDPEKAMFLRAGLYNPGAGTKFELSGEVDQRVMPGADAVPGRHSLLVDGMLEQNLEKLDGAPERLRAKGRVVVPFRVESGDLALFHARAVLKLSGVHVDLPQDRITVSGVDGELPVVEEVVMGPQGAQLVGHGERGVYPQLRFQDHSPFLGGGNYLSIQKVKVSGREVGPIAGNARVDRDVASLDQMEVSALGGKITGQCLVELRGKDTRVAFRGKVTGIRPGGGTGDDRLDAHAALTMTPYRLGLEGRVEIVRIARAHLLELLDVWDPYRADVSANRVRLGLKVGYPKQVRLHFLHGFASLAVQLGGLAGAVRIDEIRGVPIGPALARFLAPVLEESP